MSTVITRAQMPAFLEPGMRATFGMGYQNHPKLFLEVYESKKSKKSSEYMYEWVGTGMPRPKPEGEAITYDYMEQGYRSVAYHEVRSTGISITREAADDNQYFDLVKEAGKRLARSIAESTEVRAMDLFNNAFSSADKYKGGDGVGLCSNAHPTASGANQSNILSTAADLHESSLEAMLIAIKDMRDSRGLRISVQGKKLIIPNSLCFQAERILGSSKRPGTSDNDVNALMSMSMLPGGVHVNTYLQDPDAYFIQTDIPQGLTYFLKDAPDSHIYHDSATENTMVHARIRDSRTYGDWRCLHGSPGTASVIF